MVLVKITINFIENGEETKNLFNYFVNTNDGGQKHGTIEEEEIGSSTQTKISFLDLPEFQRSLHKPGSGGTIHRHVIIQLKSMKYTLILLPTVSDDLWINP